MKKTDVVKQRKWIIVAGQLVADATQPVRCPFCETADLVVFDIPMAAGVSERRIACTACKETVALRNSK
jgi:hypothetical protein